MRSRSLPVRRHGRRPVLVLECLEARWVLSGLGLSLPLAPLPHAAALVSPAHLPAPTPGPAGSVDLGVTAAVADPTGVQADLYQQNGGTIPTI